MTGQNVLANAPAAARNAAWLKTLHRWHWISAALCLIGMILFAATGITLNHAGNIEATPTVTKRKAQVPAALLPLLKRADTGGKATKAPLPPTIRQWLSEALGLSPGNGEAEWSSDEIYLPLPRPGGDAWVRIDPQNGQTEFEKTNRGWISYLNDLHKGRNTGAAWSWFIDIFAVACLVFSITGLLILKFHAGNRPSTWPLVVFGLVLPLLLALLFIH